MTDDWIDFVITKIRQEANAQIPPLQEKIALADAIELAKAQEENLGKFTKRVTAVDRTGGQLQGGIVIVKVD